ncbi:MAG: hypothetical protein ABFS46_16980 [Myxococcota bacterium]
MHLKGVRQLLRAPSKSLDLLFELMHLGLMRGLKSLSVHLMRLLQRSQIPSVRILQSITLRLKQRLTASLCPFQGSDALPEKLILIEKLTDAGHEVYYPASV